MSDIRDNIRYQIPNQTQQEIGRRYNNQQPNMNRRPDYQRPQSNTGLRPQQPKRNIPNKPSTISKSKFYTGAIVALSALLLSAGIGSGVHQYNTHNEQMDSVHDAYRILESNLQESRAIDNDEYDNYLEKLGVLCDAFEISDKKHFHEVIRSLDIPANEFLQPEQITNMALETFKVGFAKKNGIDPSTVTIKANLGKDYQKPNPEFDNKTGRYEYIKITYKNQDGETVAVVNDKFTEGSYYDFGGFNPTEEPEVYSDDIAVEDLDVIKAILAAQNNGKKAFDALREASEYLKNCRSARELPVQDEQGR